jgi:uncharacterized protein YcbK (DUF882 family)
LTRAPRPVDSGEVVVRLLLGLATVLIVTSLGGVSPATTARDQPEPEEEETPEPPPDPELPAGARAFGPTEPPTRSPKRAPLRGLEIRNTRGFVVPDERLRRRPPPPPSGNIHLHNRYWRESLKVNIYNRDGSYNAEALTALSRLLRCKRTDTTTPIEPRLFAILSHVYDRFGERRIEVTSGYRNQRRTTSNHFRGSATDIHVQGVEARKLSAYIETLDSGGMGVGLYPRGGFVHVDVRPPPSYRWIDYSPTDPGDPNRRPPAGWKLRKRRLQS